jgi:hypothetical protein
MTFWAQFAVPGVEGLAYLFIDYSEQNWSSPYDGSALILQPGPAPERFAVQSVGPSYASEFSEIDRYVIRSRRVRVEGMPTLEEGFDPVEWRWDEVPEGPDDDRDWNKVGGSPRYLQGGPPDPERLRFLFQFTAATVGHELADGAQCYGLMDAERRGWFFFESH